MVFFGHVYLYKHKVCGNAYVIFNCFDPLVQGGKAVLARELSTSYFSNLKTDFIGTVEGDTFSGKRRLLQSISNKALGELGNLDLTHAQRFINTPFSFSICTWK